MLADDDLADDGPAELDSASCTADMVSTAANSNSSDALKLVVTKEPGVNVAMSGDKLDVRHCGEASVNQRLWLGSSSSGNFDREAGWAKEQLSQTSQLC